VKVVRNCFRSCKTHDREWHKNGPPSGPSLLVTYRSCSFGRAALWDFYCPCQEPGSAGPVSSRRLVVDRASDPALDSAGRVGSGSSCVSFHGNTITTARSPRRSDKRKWQFALLPRNGSLHCCQGQPDIFGLVSTSCVTRQPKFEFRYHHMNTQ
jgi:hypothetical protein